MEKRTIIALALSFVVLGTYPLILQKMYPDYYKNRAEEKASKDTPVKTTSSVPAPATPTTPGAITPSAGTEMSIIGEGIPVSGRRVYAEFSPAGGVIQHLAFPEFQAPEKKGPLELFKAKDAAEAPLYVDAAAGLYTVSPGTDGVVLTGAAAGPSLGVTKELQFTNGGYGADLKISFHNSSASPLPLRYRLVAGSSFPHRNSIDAQYSEANFYSTRDGKAGLRHIKESKNGKTVSSEGSIEWLAIKDRHFAIILKPVATDFSAITTGLGDSRLTAALVSPEITIAPGETLTHEFKTYIGPNDYAHLAPLGFGPLVNFGKLDAIGKLLVGGLEMVYKITKNYGVAIILLTILLNILLFPLTRASYMSMKRMQLVQPQMTKIKEQNKKNPEKMNREMMELYKKHKVNPFGGCLPMILQMPVFMALYVALSKYFGLVNAPFLWVEDLSSPDRLYLPFTLPFLGNFIHLLPLIMVGAMFLQQRLTQIKLEGQDPAMEAQQRMMAIMMPIVFGFIFYSMPAGLVLYWLTNTILMTAYQLRLKNLTLTA